MTISWMRPKKKNKKKNSALTLNTIPTEEIWNLGKKQVLGNQQCVAVIFLKQDRCLYSDLRVF